MPSPVYLKAPVVGASASGPDPDVARRVSEMLSRIDKDGIDAVRAYSRELDDWDPPSFQVGADEIARATASLSDQLTQSIAFAQAQIADFARRQRATLTDFEAETLPGVFLGQRQVP
jgi:sulfopropanediol 3-dehydrogenase